MDTWIKRKQAVVPSKPDPCGFTGCTAQRSAATMSLFTRTTHKTPPSFICRGKKPSFPALATSSQKTTPWQQCVLHQPPLELIWNPAGRYEWHPVFLAGWRSHFCNGNKGQAYAWRKSSLAVGRTSLHHAAKWEMKAGFPVLPAEHWMMGCSANLLTNDFIRGWFTAQRWAYWTKFISWAGSTKHV